MVTWPTLRSRADLRLVLDEHGRFELFAVKLATVVLRQPQLIQVGRQGVFALGLLAADLLNDPATEAALNYLLTTQKFDGTWDETEFTGTGFPKVFYLEYTFYRNYFPLLALTTYAKAHNEKAEAGN